MRSDRVRFGRGGEAIAESYLTQRGYRLLARRFRLRNGELDLVMEDGGTVVFVEVRTRRGRAFGDPLESVGPLKQSRIIRAARVFLSASRLYERPCRFDVVAIVESGTGAPRIEHRVDAFRADGARG